MGLEELTESERVQMGNSNKYIQHFITDSGLHLLRDNQTRSAFVKGRERGLFHLFLTQGFLTNMKIWTNEKLRMKHHTPMSREFFLAYLGLEIASSLCPALCLKDYWSSKAFVGNRDISSVMGRDAFLRARANIKHYPEYNDEIASRDPLWHSRAMLDHFQTNCIHTAVPVDVTTLDENVIRSRGRCAAISYIKMKPD